MDSGKDECLTCGNVDVSSSVSTLPVFVIDVADSLKRFAVLLRAVAGGTAGAEEGATVGLGVPLPIRGNANAPSGNLLGGMMVIPLELLFRDTLGISKYNSSLASKADKR